MTENEFTLDGSEECFKGIFLKYITPNSAKGIDNINYEKYKFKLEENSQLISKKINDGNYKFSCYREKLIMKGRNKEPRVISIPTIRDKVVLKYIQLILKESCSDINMQIPQYYIEQFKKNIKKRETYDYIIKLDIEKYYDNIKHDILQEILIKRGIDNEIIELIKRIISRPTINENQLHIRNAKKKKNIEGTPQGLSISNMLAAIYIKEVDNLFENKNNIKYIRYVDDILVLCKKSDADILYNDIVGILKDKLRLTIHTGEKEYRHELNEKIDLCFLGYNYKFIYNKFMGFTIKDESIYKFENSIVKIFTRFNSDKDMSEEQFVFVLNNKITGSISKRIDTDNSRESKYGWLFFYSQIDDYRIPYRLDQLVDRLLIRFKRCSRIDRNKIKQFIKAFKEIKFNIKDTEYIHRPDNLSIEEKRKLLIDVFKIDEKKLIQDKTVDKLYYKFVYKPIKLSQKDIQQMIS